MFFSVTQGAKKALHGPNLHMQDEGEAARFHCTKHRLSGTGDEERGWRVGQGEWSVSMWKLGHVCQLAIGSRCAQLESVQHSP